MTKKEALEFIAQSVKSGVDMAKVADAIKALEQEPCEDAVSRQAVLDKKELVELEDGQSFYCISPEDVETLPPVTPQPKTGHWIFDDECKEHGHCSHCGYGSIDLADGEPHNFCSNCGAKMDEPQERSGEEEES